MFWIWANRVYWHLTRVSIQAYSQCNLRHLCHYYMYTRMLYHSSPMNGLNRIVIFCFYFKLYTVTSLLQKDGHERLSVLIGFCTIRCFQHISCFWCNFQRKVNSKSTNLEIKRSELLFFLGRIEMWPIATDDSVAWCISQSASLSFCHAAVLCKNGQGIEVLLRVETLKNKSTLYGNPHPLMRGNSVENFAKCKL